MALGDTLGGLTASVSLPNNGRTATIESKTNFFAAVPKGDTARAVCMPLHRGRTTIVLETRITRGDGKLAAIVTQTQLIFEQNSSRKSETFAPVPSSRYDFFPIVISPGNSPRRNQGIARGLSVYADQAGRLS